MKSLTLSRGLSLSLPPVKEIKSIDEIEPPSKIVVPLKQHMGDECFPLVKKGKKVKKGELLAKNNITCLRSPVSGKVVEIKKKFPSLYNGWTQAIVLEKDESDNSANIDFDLPLKGVLESGVIDCSSPYFPLLKKIEIAQQKKVKSLLINSLEEFFILGSRASLLNEGKDYIKKGIELICKILPCEKVFLVVYKTILDYIDLDFEGIEIIAAQPKHPIYKKNLILSGLLKKNLSFDLEPEDIGYSIFDLETIYYLGKLAEEKIPYIEKVITVSGADLREIKVLKVPIGTPISWVLEQTKVNLEEVKKIVVNGPISGKAIFDIDYPITKEINQIFVLKKEELFSYSSRVCVKCGLCVDVCPMNLIPFMIAGYSESRNFELAKKNNILCCIECGSCAFVCPVRIPLLQWIQMGKEELKKNSQT